LRGSNGSDLIRIEKSFDLPSVPLVLTKILRLIDEESATALRLEELILHDPALTARILRLANSAFYSFRSEVKTISHAITLLGLNLIKSLAIGVSIFESFTRGLKSEASTINGLWMHSFGVGTLAQDIWQPRTSRSEAEFAFLCGLLHDMGKVVCFKNDTKRYAELFAIDGDESDGDMCVREFECYGLTHASIGSMLASRWGLPSDLATVVQEHHDPMNSDLPLVSVVSMADMVAKRCSIGYDGDNMVSPDLDSLREQLRMDEEEFEQITVSAQSKREEAQDFFRMT
jgi:HD-like signal output (HDOD) protein